MTPSQRLTAATVALATLLGFLTWLTRPDPAADWHTLSDLKTATIRHIRLSRNGRLIADLAREDGEWRMLAPRPGRADPRMIQRLLQLPQARSFRQPPLPADPTPLGLRPPRARIRYDDTELLFGAVEPVNHKRYVQVGRRLHLIHDRFARIVLQSAPQDFLLTGSGGAGP